ncbi:5472_t:CDS:2, partial [Cetraspora pellucida]
DEFNVINNRLGKHKEVSCRYCPYTWARGRAQEIKSYLAMKCKGRVPREVRVKVLQDLQNYTKILNPSYDPPKRTILASSILDSEVANIIIKVENELSKTKNLTLCVDNFSKFLHTANFNAEKIIEVLENIGPKKFIVIVSDAEMSMIAAKKQSNYGIFSAQQNELNFLEPGAYKNYVLKKALEIWKQLGDSQISADLLKTQISLYKNHETFFDDRFIASADTITNCFPYNATYKHVFSILNWYFGKRYTRLSIECLEVIAQMHSFLVENAKLEQNYVDQNISQEDLLSIFNQIANSVKDGTNLF